MTTLRKLKTVAKKVPGVRQAGRAVMASMDANTAILQKIPVFSPYSAGDSEMMLKLALNDANTVFPVLRTLLLKTGAELPKVVDAEAFPETAEERSACAQLAERFRHYGSDKAGVHNYHLVYGSIIARIAEFSAMLEVGLGTNNTDIPSNMGAKGSPGASLRAFRDHASEAQIFGADIDRRILFSEDRISTYFVDQTELDTFDRLGGDIGRELDLVIDDGLHSPAANLAVVQFAAERVRPGGFIVVEDIAFAAQSVWEVVGVLLQRDYECVLVTTNVALMFVARKRTSPVR
ncbi:hypothetical protein [Sphingosinithalassobacter sp. CS137]|uniref:hypothetical protein n=1 Tax=Sphingosinithalassobacter sp. CS137 TaxID=2762748 RepID=UPI00165DE826|nr:hypothetical protein [Sphingosinithalassobacter sp. CS137]